MNNVTLPLSYKSKYSIICQGIDTSAGMRFKSDTKTLSYFSFDSNTNQQAKHEAYWCTIGY